MKQNSINKENAIKELALLKEQVSKLEKVINSPEKITDIIHSFEDAVEYKGFQIPHYWQYLPKHKVDQEKAEFVISVLNEGWVADVLDTSQIKYTIIWKPNSSRVGLSFGGCDGWGTGTAVGAFLLLKNADLCRHIGNSPKIVELFEGFMIAKKAN